MDIAIDFDGTCVTHEYPKVGRDIGAQKVLKRLVANGHRLILFTMRSFMPGISPITKGMEDGGLRAAIDWFDINEIPLYGVQSNPGQKTWTESPKAYAQLYIDDAALGCPLLYPTGERPHVNWIMVEQMLEQRKLI